MAYVTGTATTVDDLRTALFNACTANGWTLSGEVLHKGACYARLQVVSGMLTVLGGTGIDVSNALTTPGPQINRLGAAASMVLTYPCSYEIFIGTAPDEVYLVVNSNVSYYQWLAFGCSPVAGLPGTGNWYGAMLPASNTVSLKMDPTGAGNTAGTGAGSGGLFWQSRSISPSLGMNGFVHHGLADTAGVVWSNGDASGASMANAVSAMQPLIQRTPNTWNGEATLLPVQPYLARPSSKVSLIADLAHVRYLRIDNYNPGDIITLGTDRWKAFPWWQKNASSRDGADGSSGTLGFAVRYDGP